MSGASFVRCHGCGRLMLGQHGYPQPHVSLAVVTDHGPRFYEALAKHDVPRKPHRKTA